MKELHDIYKEAGQDFINELLTNYVIVTEKLSGSSFAFEKSKSGLQFFKGTSQKPINLVDRTIMVYYEPAIEYITKKIGSKKIPENWRFCFQYFVHNEPGMIAYSKLPDNNLVLTHIHVKNEAGKTAKVIDDPRVINDWAETLGVTGLKPFFAGYLDSEQKSKIKEFISIPIEDQEELFGTSSFAEYVLTVLNPKVKATTLHGDLNNPIDSLIFKFVKAGDGKSFSGRMLDPYARTLMKEKVPIDMRRAPADINEIILLDLLAFIEERGIKKTDAMKSGSEERYIELISTLFNDYVTQNNDSLNGVQFNNADFASGPEFELNLDLIDNTKTKELVSSSDSFGDLYKVMLGSLRKKRDPNKESAVLTPSVIEDFNKMVDKINKISGRDVDDEFKTFEDYLKMKEVSENISTDPTEDINEERILNFNDFVSLKRVKVGAVIEALSVPYKEPGQKPVNIIVGRFQPFTMGHVKVFEKLHKQNGYPIVVFTVRGKKVDLEKSPFGEDEQQAMFAKMKKEYPFLEAMYVVSSAAIDTLFATVRPAYEPILWGYGTDRKRAYEGMINKPEYRKDLGVDPNFDGHEIKRTDDDVSASKARKALELDDEATFKKMTPKSIHDMYPILKDILTPIGESYDEDGEIITEAKETDLSVEIKEPGSIYNSPFLIDLIVKSNKVSEYNEFVKFFPRGLIADAFINYINGLDERQTKDIVSKFQTLSKPEQLKASDLYAGNSSTPMAQMYSLEPKGIGRGEVAIAWLIKSAHIQGGGESYDVNIKGKKYEVKSYEMSNDAIRAGVKAKVTNFGFWNELLDTISRIDKLTGFSSGTTKFNLSSYFPPDFIKATDAVMQERTSIFSGEIGKGRLKKIQRFYDLAAAIESNISGFSNLILRGPHIKPTELSIIPISEEQVANGEFTVRVTPTDESLTYILSELRRLKYVRDPSAFLKDLQKAVEVSAEGTTYIVFRKTKVNIVKPSGFEFSHITGAAVKFIEKDL